MRLFCVNFVTDDGESLYKEIEGDTVDDVFDVLEELYPGYVVISTTKY